ncbi:unnamed protein product [Ambrosiozyma monospora]|uniref:Unnamed protein product n=1 Tax=Ambrosiozyma monospora TaxID=43982 RepID=A0ACB5TQI2_AMBMO|nr:unnamed protein product [Ambrosiozyma monospora]
MSIQGWFHIPQPGEDGYIPGEQEKTEARSTLQQLESKELKEYDFPKLQFNELPPCELKELAVSEDEELKLSKDDIKYLAQFVNPSLLTKESLEKLNNIFTEESVVDVMSFLNTEYETLLKKQMKQLELNEYPPMPQQQSEVKYPWKLAGPSHKQRYIYIDGLPKQDMTTAESIVKMNTVTSQEQPSFGLTKQYIELEEKLNPIPEAVKLDNPQATTAAEVDIKLCELAQFFKSISFKKWLYQVTGLTILKDQILIRRFRPGHDFILATKLDENEGEDKTRLLDGVLEATLNLTPSSGWENGEHGGYEIGMIDEDAEVIPDEKLNQFNEDEAAIYKSSDKDESLVYESQASWNNLSLIFRDESVLKFVKYVSFQAVGSRWDISCSWKCKNDGAEDDEN